MSDNTFKSPLLLKKFKHKKWRSRSGYFKYIIFITYVILLYSSFVYVKKKKTEQYNTFRSFSNDIADALHTNTTGYILWAISLISLMITLYCVYIDIFVNKHKTFIRVAIGVNLILEFISFGITTFLKFNTDSTVKVGDLSYANNIIVMIKTMLTIFVFISINLYYQHHMSDRINKYKTLLGITNNELSKSNFDTFGKNSASQIFKNKINRISNKKSLIKAQFKSSRHMANATNENILSKHKTNVNNQIQRQEILLKKGKEFLNSEAN